MIMDNVTHVIHFRLHDWYTYKLNIVTVNVPSVSDANVLINSKCFCLISASPVTSLKPICLFPSFPPVFFLVKLHDHVDSVSFRRSSSRFSFGRYPCYRGLHGICLAQHRFLFGIRFFRVRTYIMGNCHSLWLCLNHCWRRLLFGSSPKLLFYSSSSVVLSVSVDSSSSDATYVSSSDYFSSDIP